jgi:hypothetical protein
MRAKGSKQTDRVVSYKRRRPTYPTLLRCVAFRRAAPMPGGFVPLPQQSCPASSFTNYPKNWSNVKAMQHARNVSMLWATALASQTIASPCCGAVPTGRRREDAVDLADHRGGRESLGRHRRDAGRLLQSMGLSRVAGRQDCCVSPPNRDPTRNLPMGRWSNTRRNETSPPVQGVVPIARAIRVCRCPRRR